MKERIVLADAGGLQASAAIRWLAEADNAEVVTLTLDLGQGRDLEEIRDRALAAGAVRAHVLDVREAFARDFVLPALQAGALHEGRDPMAAALARPLIARTLLEIASIERATAIAHGCTGLDQQRMDTCARALDPDMRVITTARAGASSQSTHANLWGRVSASAKPQVPNPKSQIPNPKSDTPHHKSHITHPKSQAPDAPACVEIAFERGVPSAINGVPMALTELIEILSIIAGQHGVGRIAIEESGGEWVEEPGATGALLRYTCDAPAAVVLHAARTALETSMLPRELRRLKRDRATQYADLVWNGLWFTPLREAMDAHNAREQEHVSGSARITLFKGAILSSEAAGLNAERGTELDADLADATVQGR